MHHTFSRDTGAKSSCIQHFRVLYTFYLFGRHWYKCERYCPVSIYVAVISATNLRFNKLQDYCTNDHVDRNSLKSLISVPDCLCVSQCIIHETMFALEALGLHAAHV